MGDFRVVIGYIYSFQGACKEVGDFDVLILMGSGLDAFLGGRDWIEFIGGFVW